MTSASLEDADSRPFWQGVREGRLLFQHCDRCNRFQHPPRHLCSSCWNDSLSWIESPGHGRIESVTVVHRAPTPAFRADVPYAVASVTLDEGIRMITNLVGDGRLDARIGDKVAVVFEPDRQDRMLPRFRVVETAKAWAQNE